MMTRSEYKNWKSMVLSYDYQDVILAISMTPRHKEAFDILCDVYSNSSEWIRYLGNEHKQDVLIDHAIFDLIEKRSHFIEVLRYHYSDTTKTKYHSIKSLREKYNIK